jgi:hypothetical protein
VDIVTAYSELSAFQFQSGKGYDKRSVEHFKALSLGAVDELLREVTQLRNQLLGASEAAPSGVVLNAEEELLLGRFRTADDETRKVMLIGRAPAAPFGTNQAPPQAPIGFDMSPSGPGGSGFSSAAPPPYAETSRNAEPTWTQDVPPSPAGWTTLEPQAESFSDPSDPDAPEWLRALAEPDPWSSGDLAEGGADSNWFPGVALPGTPPIPPIPPASTIPPEPTSFAASVPLEPITPSPFSLPEPVEAMEPLDQPANPPVAEPPGWSDMPAWGDPAEWTEPAAAQNAGFGLDGPAADLQPSMDPPGWHDVPAEPVLATAQIDFAPTEADRQLDDLFNQLDFGPPPAGVLEVAGAFAEAPGQGLALPGSAAPLRVDMPSDQPQRLPTPTPPWSGWIKPSA